MSAPTIVTIRPGVAFEPGAAASWQRMEAAAGKAIDCNSSYRDYDEQMQAWQAYVDYINGVGPWAPYALHPDQSMHCKGLASDSDDQSLILSMPSYGWRQTALAVGEPWHFDYQSWNDKHIGEPAGGGSVPFPTPDDPEEEEEMRGMKGARFVRGSDKVEVKFLFNEASGFYCEHSGGDFDNAISAQWETGSWPTVTESYAGAVKRALEQVRKRA